MTDTTGRATTEATTAQPPPIDRRDRQAIVDQTSALAARLSDWRPRPDGSPDPGTALIGVFARFAELLVQRVNRVPERNYLSFLNLIGTRPQPPLPARVPLTFGLAERGPSGAVVPEGTQVAATAVEGEDEEVVFETDTDLVLTRAQLRAVFVGDASNDRYAERTAAATGELAEPFDAFTGDQPVAHQLFLACDPVLTGPGAKTVTFRVASSRAALLDGWPISWSYWDGTRWQSLAVTTEVADGWRVTVADLPRLSPHEVNGISAGWVRAQLDTAPPREETVLPTVDGIDVLSSTPPEPVPTPEGYANSTPLDLSKDFYPFGEQPRFNDTCYLACPDDLARPGTALRVEVTLTNPEGTEEGPVPPVSSDGSPRVAWEAWDGTAWRAVTGTGGQAVDYAFTDTGTVLLMPPPGFTTTEVNGSARHWLRVRLVGGDYGVDAGYAKNPDGGYDLVPATFAPPVVTTLTWKPARAGSTATPVTACVTSNDFRMVTHLGAEGQPPLNTPFTPFTRSSEVDPALHLGFDQPFANRPVTLYLQVEPPAPEEVTADRLTSIDPADRAELVWEYRAASGWQRIAAVDETGALAGRGVVRFVGPTDLTAAEHFGRHLCWVRLRWRRGAFPLPPRLRRVLPNTTWASHATTVTGETLGSGTGEADQRLTAAQTSVLAGQRLEVREPEPPRPAEAAALAAVEGPGAVTVTTDPDEVWVRWHEVVDFHRSGPLDRHYTLDPRTGEVRFGDGQAGRVPPRGRNNVRLTYRTGGGPSGNRAVGTVVTLNSAVPYVDTVTNHEPSQGGSGWEPLDRVRARGPRTLRHRDRAVTAEDFEDVAFESSAEVARVSAVLPSRYDPFDLWLEPEDSPKTGHRESDAGAVGVIVVPNSAGPRPVPSLELLRHVQAHLRARCCATTELWVAGPEWVAVTVTATVVPSSVDTADLVRDRLTTAFDRYLHPLTGGSDGTGWAFGRKPHRSDLFAVAEAVAGVGHVRSLTVDQTPESEELGARLTAVLNRPLAEGAGQPVPAELARWLSRALVYSGRHQITVTLGG